MKTAKFLVALIGAALSGVVGVIPVDSTAARIAQFALAVLAAVTVYFVPNASASQRSNGEMYGRSTL